MHARHWWRTLTGEGLDWLMDTGRMRLVRKSTVVVYPGEPMDTLFIVLDGRLAVRRSDRAAREADAVYPGEIIGDALSTDKPPSPVALVAVEDSCVFAVSKAHLAVKLGDPAFASRFYRTLALLLASSAERRLAQRPCRLTPLR